MSIRKARTMEDLIADKGFPFHVGQLIGSAEMVSWWMSLQEDVHTREMGSKLAETVGWFFRDAPSGSVPAKALPGRSEEDTLVMKRDAP